MTLVELLIASAVLLTLMTVVSVAISSYLRAGNAVITTYTGTDQFTPTQIIIQRLIRSQVEPADVQTQTTAPTCPSVTTAVVGAPCPAFVTASVGTYSTAFFANIGDPNGPGKIVMGLGTASQCKGCNYYSAPFSVTQYPACPYQTTGTPLAGCQLLNSSKNNVCPTQANLAAGAAASTQCTWSTAGTRLVTIPNVVNGGPQSQPTSLPYASTPIFTYNTIDQYSTTLVLGDGGTANASTGILPGFAACGAPTTDANGNPTSTNCAADDVQSVQVALVVHAPGTRLSSGAQNANATVENSYTVYRLSSSSFLFSSLVG